MPLSHYSDRRLGLDYLKKIKYDLLYHLYKHR
jgi:hypothetical protein